MVAGDGCPGGRGEGPLGVLELRGCEQGADGLVGRARVAQAVKPENVATGGGGGGHGAVWERTRGLALDKGGEEVGGGEGDGDEG